MAGDSLKKYEQRTRSAIEQFIAWKKDPLNYKPPSWPRPHHGDTCQEGDPPHAAREDCGGQHPHLRRTGGAPLTPPPNPQIASLPVQIPIRGGKFIVQLSIPVDLTTEGNRITTVIQAFGQAPSPESFA